MATQTLTKTSRKSKDRSSLNCLYAYCSKTNAEHARRKGKKEFGSVSAYLDSLVSKDRGLKVSHAKPKAKN